MAGTGRLILAGIAATYLVCIAAQFFGPYPALASSNLFGIAVVILLVVAIGLHVAAAVAFRSWTAIISSGASIVVLAVLVLAGLMRITGDSL
jgi:hypothetical protein